MAPDLRDDDCRELIRARGTGLALAGLAAVAAIWPKELVDAFAVEPGHYSLALFVRVVEFDGLSGTTPVPAIVSGGPAARR